MKQTICKVTVRANKTVTAFDENGKEMLFFSGDQSIAMKRIKARIEKQKPCILEWFAEEGAAFQGIDNNPAKVFYGKSEMFEIPSLGKKEITQ